MFMNYDSCKENQYSSIKKMLEISMIRISALYFTYPTILCHNYKVNVEEICFIKIISRFCTFFILFTLKISNSCNRFHTAT